MLPIRLLPVRLLVHIARRMRDGNAVSASHFEQGVQALLNAPPDGVRPPTNRNLAAYHFLAAIDATIRANPQDGLIALYRVYRDVLGNDPWNNPSGLD